MHDPEPMQDGRVSAADAAGAGLHTATPQWQSFELRMRERRATRCARRARVALEAGLLKDASEALEEARSLNSRTPDVDELTREIAAARTVTESRTRQRTSRRLAMLGSIVLLGGVFGQAVGDWGPPQETGGNEVHPVITQNGSSVRLPDVLSAPAPEASPVSPPAASPVFAPVEEVDREQHAPLPSARADGPSINLQSREAIAASPDSTIPRVAPAVSAPDHAVPPELARASTLGWPSVGSLPAPEPVAPMPTPLPLLETREVSRVMTPPPPPAPVADQRAAVRATLGKYESAYSQLDVSAVQAVWPRLDRRALGKAFEGLASQRVTFDACDVNVNGASARATCSGTAAWTPKVGGGLRSTSRRWSFDLAQAEGAWRIVQADVR